jgi:thiamine pyrophosphokinase
LAAMDTTAIVANGQIDSYEIIRPLIRRHPKVVAVDGGLIHCQKMGIRPHLIVGDFDSCPPSLLEQYQGIPQIVLQRDKNETDLEVAIQGEGGKQITLYGAWGRRMDHSLTNALLLARWPIAMETETERVFAIDKRIKLPCFAGQTISLIPLYGPVSGITTQGLKWELQNGKMDQNFIGISNICLGTQAEISVQTGSLLCCMLKEGFA